MGDSREWRVSKVEEGKFVRMFDRSEIRLTACAVTKDQAFDFVFREFDFSDKYFREPNQFWQRDPENERALVKLYKRYIDRYSLCYDATQAVKIPMPFPGNNFADGWGELQFLIKAPRLVKLARHRSFDTRVNRWVEETKLIEPKTNLGTHSYLALRFYHQNFLPPIPKKWRFEPVYVSVMNLNCAMFYRVDVLWEKEEVKITITILEKNSPEIPKHLK